MRLNSCCLITKTKNWASGFCLKSAKLLFILSLVLLIKVLLIKKKRVMSLLLALIKIEYCGFIKFWIFLGACPIGKINQYCFCMCCQNSEYMKYSEIFVYFLEIHDYLEILQNKTHRYRMLLMLLLLMLHILWHITTTLTTVSPPSSSLWLCTSVSVIVAGTYTRQSGQKYVAPNSTWVLPTGFVIRT